MIDMDDIYSTLFALMMGDKNRGEIVGRDEVNNYTIDTCYTLDCGWETAVCKGEGDWIVVARYETKEQAQEGHEDWIYACGCFPTSAWSIQTERYEEF
jgi:hypothetical protein